MKKAEIFNRFVSTLYSLDQNNISLKKRYLLLEDLNEIIFDTFQNLEILSGDWKKLNKLELLDDFLNETSENKIQKTDDNIISLKCDQKVLIINSDLDVVHIVDLY
jgi:2-C-methyl-D-erythritol 4-phosphate cytidylyltransferase